MNPLRNLWRTYRMYGRRGAYVLARYYAAKVHATVAGPGRECPVCGWTGREFHPIVYPDHGLWRTKASCPRCGAFERHRALWFAYGDFFRTRSQRMRILHFAPELCFRDLFKSRSSRYVTSNYVHERSDLRLDLANVGLIDGSFDLIIANGVLTSVPDHRGAIESLYRVLTPGGFALICDVVSPDDVTRENAERPMGLQRSIGGRDLQDSFRPFDATLVNIAECVPERDRERFRVPGDDFYLIRLEKPAS